MTSAAMISLHGTRTVPVGTPATLPAICAACRSARDHTESVWSVPNMILRFEGAAVLAAAALAYGEVGSGRTFFALLFLVPDLSMLGYR